MLAYWSAGQLIMSMYLLPAYCLIQAAETISLSLSLHVLSPKIKNTIKNLGYFLGDNYLILFIFFFK